MAMATYLQRVSDEQLAALERDPGGINRLDEPIDFRTHFAGALNYFITGSAWPGDEPLAAMLYGSRSVAASTLENGSFGVIESGEVAGLLAGLEAVAPSALRAAVDAADLDELIEDEELYELEVIDPSKLADTLVEDLAGLVRFYRQVAEAGGAVVSYTT